MPVYSRANWSAAVFMKSTVMISSRRTALVALIAIVFATTVVRGAPTCEAPPEATTRPTCNFDLNYLAVVSDFDGDRRLDQAEIHLAGAHHCIRVRFGNTRETHLDFGTRPHSNGVLLVRDANRDNRPDLIWVYRSRSESVVIWLNDGAGHFTRSSDGSRDAVPDSLFGDNNYARTGGLECKEISLAPARPASDFEQVASVEGEAFKAVMNPRLDLRRDLGLYLSYLRERGPPQHV